VEIKKVGDCVGDSRQGTFTRFRSATADLPPGGRQLPFAYYLTKPNFVDYPAFDPVTALRSVPGCHHKPTILGLAVYYLAFPTPNRGVPTLCGVRGRGVCSLPGNR